jgi:hypothetical protein
MKMQAGKDILLEKGYKKHAWVLLFVVGIMGAVGTYPFLLGIEPSPQYFKSMTGITWDSFLSGGQGMVPYVRDSLRITGVLFIGMCIFIMAISATSFRKGERWAWYVLWYYPIMLGWVSWLLYADGGNEWDSLPLHIVLTVMCLLGLLLPYRKFFPVRGRSEVS